MKQHRHLHLYQLMFIPIGLIVVLVVGVYGGAAWLIFKMLEYVAREIKRIESNDSVVNEEDL